MGNGILTSVNKIDVTKNFQDREFNFIGNVLYKREVEK